MFITYNAFNVFWLQTDVDDKQINKRFKEILNFFHIEETPNYEFDLPFVDYTQVRTDETVKDCHNLLTNHTKKAWESLLWFQLVDSHDEEMFQYIVEGKYDKASKGWMKLFSDKKKYHYLKNYVILELLSYENQKSFTWYDFSDVPSSIVESFYTLRSQDVFWKSFKKIFDIQNEIEISDEIIAKMRHELPQVLAEAFFDISHELNKPALYKEFVWVFNVHAKELEDNTEIVDMMKEIESNMDQLQDMDLGEELDEVIELVNETIKLVKKLDKVWLWDNTKIIKLKDQVWSKIRWLWIKLNNDYDDEDNAIEFIKEAAIVVYSNDLKQKFKKDIQDIKRISQNNSESLTTFQNVIELYKEGKSLMDSKNFGEAHEVFNTAATSLLVIADSVGMSNSNLKKLQSKIALLFYGEDLLVAANKIDEIKKLIQEWWFSRGDDLEFYWLGEWQQAFLLVFVDCVGYGKMCTLMQRHSVNNQTYEDGIPLWVWKLVGWIIFIIIMIAVNS
jgi:hypothetical protein